jgi:hypothetical protein
VAIILEIGFDCPHCDDAFACTRTLDFSQSGDQSKIQVDFEMLVAQSTFECPECGCSFWTGDVDAVPDDRNDCSHNREKWCEECRNENDECSCADDDPEGTDQQ